MEKLSREMETARELILKTFGFLETDYLLSPEFKLEESAVFLEYCAVEYTNEIKRRNVRIAYAKGEVYSEIKYTFDLGITRIPHTGHGDMISLSNYLQSKGKDFNTSIVDKFDAEQAEKILQQIANVLRDELLEVVNGDVWYETYYPRKD